MSDVDNGICTKCDLRVVFDNDVALEALDDNEDVCVRSKSYCTSKHEHVNWRDRWKAEKRDAELSLEGWKKAKEQLGRYETRALRLQDIMGWDGTAAGVNFDVFCQQVVADRDRLTAELELAKRERDEWERKWADARCSSAMAVVRFAGVASTNERRLSTGTRSRRAAWADRIALSACSRRTMTDRMKATASTTTGRCISGGATAPNAQQRSGCLEVRGECV